MDITDKNYKKLVIQIALNAMAFCCIDLLKKETVFIKTIDFEGYNNNLGIEDFLQKIINENSELLDNYDEIMIIHDNNLATFVPTALFDKQYIGSYLQYNIQVFETDFFAFDELVNYEMNNVYIPYININNFFIDQLGIFEYKHAHSILVSKLLGLSKNNDTQKMFVHLAKNHFEIVVIKNKQLLLFNSFEYKTPEDFLYYILFTAEQLQMNPENFNLELLGNVHVEDPFFQLAYTYIRNTSLFNAENRPNNTSEEEYRNHFILLNS